MSAAHVGEERRAGLCSSAKRAEPSLLSTRHCSGRLASRPRPHGPGARLGSRPAPPAFQHQRAPASSRATPPHLKPAQQASSVSVLCPQHAAAAPALPTAHPVAKGSAHDLPPPQNSSCLELRPRKTALERPERRPSEAESVSHRRQQFPALCTSQLLAPSVVIPANHAATHNTQPAVLHQCSTSNVFTAVRCDAGRSEILVSGTDHERERTFGDYIHNGEGHGLERHGKGSEPLRK
jgi:hypothetical protein